MLAIQCHHGIIHQNSASGGSHQQVAPPIMRRCAWRCTGSHQCSGTSVQHDRATCGDVLCQRGGEPASVCRYAGFSEASQARVHDHQTRTIQGWDISIDGCQGREPAGQLVRQPDIVLIDERDTIRGTQRWNGRTQQRHETRRRPYPPRGFPDPYAAPVTDPCSEFRENGGSIVVRTVVPANRIQFSCVCFSRLSSCARRNGAPL